MHRSRLTSTTRDRRGGWVVPALVVVVVLLLLAAGLGLRAMIRGAADGAGPRQRARPTTFYWPQTQPAGPGAGRVGVILADKRFASVGDVRPEDWKLNDEVRFLDADGRALAHGAVRAILKGTLHVAYDPEPGAPRAIQEGDRAIRTGKTLAGPHVPPDE